MTKPLKLKYLAAATTSGELAAAAAVLNVMMVAAYKSLNSSLTLNTKGIWSLRYRNTLMAQAPSFRELVIEVEQHLKRISPDNYQI